MKAQTQTFSQKRENVAFEDINWIPENSCIFPQTAILLQGLPLWIEPTHFHLNEEYTPRILGSSIHEMTEVMNLDNFTNGLENFIATEFFKVPEVECVFFSKKEKFTKVTTVINVLDRKVREKIYELEYHILTIFRDFHLDFRVICRNDRDVREIRPINAMVVFNK